MSLKENAPRLFGVAAVAAVIAGSVTGTLLTIDDEAWPGRGGMKAMFQISALFSAYAFAIALPAGILLSLTLAPAMARAGPVAHVVAGLLIGLALHLLVDLAIGERIDAWEDFIGGALAGAAAALLWWATGQRRERRTTSNG